MYQPISSTPFFPRKIWIKPGSSGLLATKRTLEFNLDLKKKFLFFKTIFSPNSPPQQRAVLFLGGGMGSFVGQPSSGYPAHPMAHLAPAWRESPANLSSSQNAAASELDVEP